MTPLDGAALALAFGEAILAILGVAASRTLRPILDFLPTTPPAGPLPSVSIVVTAKDEERDIVATVEHFLAQTHVDLELIVVNDRSTDATGARLDELARAVDVKRLRVIHNTELPKGWLGKSHACQLGAAAARKSWILFSDGDVRLVPSTFLARALAHAEAEHLDHLALIPDTRPMSLLKEALILVFGKMYALGTLAHEQESDRRRGGGGVGAFNLMRRSVWETIGGHAALPLDTGDDFKIGRLIKRHGFRQRLRHGQGAVLCPWHTSMPALIRGLEKNMFGGFHYSFFELTAFTLGVCLGVFGPWALALLSIIQHGATPSLTLLPLAVLLVGGTYEWWFYGRRLNYRATNLVLHPIGAALLLLAAWNSAIQITRRGGVRWRDSFYPLAELRRHQLP